MKTTTISLFALVAICLTAFNALSQPTLSDSGSAAVTSKEPIPLDLRDSRGHKVALRYQPILSNGVAPVFMKVTMAVGPLLGSSSFAGFTLSGMPNLLDDQNPPGAPNNDPTKYATLGHRLAPGYITAPPNGSGVKMHLGRVNPTNSWANEGGNTIWATVHVWSERMFYPTGLVCSWTSSWSGFNKTEAFSMANIAYSSTSEGAIWGSGGRRANDTYVQGGLWGDVKVNEFTFLGSAAKTMNSSTQAESDSNASWMGSFVDFELIATWTLLGETGEVLARYSKKVQTTGEPVPTSLSIVYASGNTVWVGVNAETNRTGVILGAPTLTSSWEELCLANAGDKFHFPQDSPTRYFRFRVEP